MIRNLVSWFTIVVLVIGFSGFITGCEGEKVKESTVEAIPPVEKAPTPKQAAPPETAAIPEEVTVKEAPPEEPKPTLPQVSIQTTIGEIVLELYPEKAPITVKNFLDYVNDNFYDGLIFHRAWPGFVIQGGGFTPDLEEKETGKPIRNEAESTLSNTRGTVAMARLPKADSATSQFFINLSDNTGLDYGKPVKYPDGTVDTAGYAVFGKVIKGMDVVDKIADVPTTTKFSEKGQQLQRCPLNPIKITEVKVISK